jgi:hypothetical protein
MCSVSKNEYLKYDWKKESWNILFVFGIFLGAVAVNYFLPYDGVVELSKGAALRLEGLGITKHFGLMPEQLFSFARLGEMRTLVIVILGGFFVGFGTRYAIMGLSLLSLGSLVAVIGFFIGGLLMSWFGLPFILS